MRMHLGRLRMVPRDYLAIAAIILLGFVIYTNTFGNGLFWDDNDFIVNNRFVHDWNYFDKYFSENVIAGAGLVSNYWRPVLLSVFSLEWHLWGAWAPGYHVVNTLFHITDALLLYFILKALLKKLLSSTHYPLPATLSFLVSLIFVAHPLQTEAVAYVNSLGDSLSVFFMFLGILVYQKYSTRSTYHLLPTAYCLPFYILALLSKETAIIFPALLFIVDLFSPITLPASLPSREGTIWNKLTLALKRTWPLFALAALYVFMRATALNFSNTFNLYSSANALTQSIWVRILTFFHTLAIYAGLLFAPHDLHMERTIPFATSFLSWPVIAGAALALALLALAAVAYKKHPIITFGILWFFIGLSPTSNIAVPINGLVYEHWLYLPLVGIFLVIIYAIFNIAPALDGRGAGRVVLISLSVIYLSFFSYVAFARNRDWHDPITFYNQTLRYGPNNYRITNNLGMAYADAGRAKDAEDAYRRAIALEPSVAVAYHNLGNLYRAEGDNRRAEENFKKALELDPKFIFSLNSLIQLYAQTKAYGDGTKFLTEFIAHAGGRADLYFLRAGMESGNEQFAAALADLRAADRLDPGNPYIQGAIANIEQGLHGSRK